jgi:hypothetical protein
MSYDELDAAREEYESDVANRALEECGLEYVLDNQFAEVRQAVEGTQAEEWLARSDDWLQLVSIISQHDREQLRGTIRSRAYDKGIKPSDSGELHLFNLASEISKFLESLANKHSAENNDALPTDSMTLIQSSRYGYRPGPAAPPLAFYSPFCTLEGSLDWASDLIALVRTFREILFLIADPDKNSPEWELSKHMKILDGALIKGTQPRLVYRGRGKEHQFGREPSPRTAPLSAIIANWMSEYLCDYSNLIDLGVCIECGRIFSRQRSDNSYCSKTCQNRAAYKRRKIFEGGLLQKIVLTPATTRERLHAGLWAYHVRLGLGVVEGVEEKFGPYVSVRFPQTIRIFRGRDLFGEGADAVKVEFYKETDSAALAELL